MRNKQVFFPSSTWTSAKALTWCSRWFKFRGGSKHYLSCATAEVASAGGSSSQPISTTRSAGSLLRTPCGWAGPGVCMSLAVPSGNSSSSLRLSHKPAAAMHRADEKNPEATLYAHYPGCTAAGVLQSSKGCMRHRLLRPNAHSTGHLAASLQMHRLSRGSLYCTGSHQCLSEKGRSMPHLQSAWRACAWRRSRPPAG